MLCGTDPLVAAPRKQKAAATLCGWRRPRQDREELLLLFLAAVFAAFLAGVLAALGAGLALVFATCIAGFAGEGGGNSEGHGGQEGQNRFHKFGYLNVC